MCGRSSNASLCCLRGVRVHDWELRAVLRRLRVHDASSLRVDALLVHDVVNLWLLGWLLDLNNLCESHIYKPKSVAVSTRRFMAQNWTPRKLDRSTYEDAQQSICRLARKSK